MSKVYKMSRKKYDEFLDELEYLKTVKEKEVKSRIKEARSFGDLGENSEYDDAKDEQGKLYSRMLEIEAILSNYQIICESDAIPDEVCIGSSVTLCYDDGSTDTFKIVGSQEADPLNMLISDESPLGHAIIGKKKDDEVEYHTPQGLTRCKICCIE